MICLHSQLLRHHSRSKPPRDICCCSPYGEAQVQQDKANSKRESTKLLTSDTSQTSQAARSTVIWRHITSWRHIMQPSTATTPTTDVSVLGVGSPVSSTCTRATTNCTTLRCQPNLQNTTTAAAAVINQTVRACIARHLPTGW